MIAAVAVAWIAIGGGSDEKPVGTGVFAWANRVHTDCQTLKLKGDRHQIRLQSAEHALRGILTLLDAREH